MITDSCPQCCRRGIRPSVAHRARGRLVSAYDCPACGHTWTTSRLLAAYQPAARPTRKAS